MARDQAEVTCPPGQWTELTNADVTAITFQVMPGSAQVEIRGTVGSVTPTETGGFVYASTMQVCEGEMQVPLSSLFYASGVNRVWAQPVSSVLTATVIVDHA